MPDMWSLGSDVAQSVQLNADYVMPDPHGWPSRPSFTGAATVQYPHTIPQGTVLDLLECEAGALIAATVLELAAEDLITGSSVFGTQIA